MKDADATFVLLFTGRFTCVGEFLLSGKQKSVLPGEIRSYSFLPRSFLSVTACMFALIKARYLNQTLTLLVPRSNSRALISMVKIVRPNQIATYSDGLGDAVHVCHFERCKQYSGHIGFEVWSDQPLLATVPIGVMVEPWTRHIRYDVGGGILIILKAPKEHHYERDLLRAQYSRLVMRLAAKADIFISGDIGLLTTNARLRVKDIGGLTSLEKTVRIRFAIGMPSTVFCSLASVMPLTSLKIMDLIYKKSQIDCFLKYREMKEKLIKGCTEIAKQTCT